ncbi:DEAD/DEAH box helicase [Pseudonocardia parietis]|uniref:AAA domain-containing protein n=1 Tax=Pseudonocardia parietis TaxID=570936 RepID=A0ABS4W3H9_9PSEU|nr:DEAD/DEAH box helicase [Pseudonocardia parietis]MBP2370767.1 hypothetical protein [Pseudonocardia parietis]
MDSKYEWCYTVYLGLYPTARVVTELERVLGPESPHIPRKKETLSAVAGFVVDGRGVIAPESSVLSGAAWATGRLSWPGPTDSGWLDGLDDEQEALRRGLAGLSGPEPPSSDTSEPDSAGGRPESHVVAVVGRHFSSAATDALEEGARSTGTAVTGVTAAAVGAVAGPLFGGVVGAVAGKFVERVLSLRRSETTGSGDASEKPATPTRTPARLDATADYVTARHLAEFVEDLAAALDIGDALAPSGIRVKCWLRLRRPEQPDRSIDPPMLNSMLVDDLDRIARSVGEGDAGRALLDYLTDDAGLERSTRIDVRQDRETVLAAVRPERKPAGRWPEKISQPLVMAQQFAVDAIRDDLTGGEGVFAVNGPPGTGKTTLLRDLVAALVVDRADVMANLDRPEQAFAGEETYDDGERKRWIHVLRPELTGFEMVVATNGNDAAQNITHEIPDASAVATEFDARTYCDYFPELADDLVEKETWGLVAAALGKRGNNRKFTSRVVWGDGPPRRAGCPDPPRRTGLKNWLDESEPGLSWTDSVKRYRSARREVDELVRRQVSIVAAHDRVAVRRSRVEVIERERREVDEELAVQRGNEQRHRARFDTICKRLVRLDADLDRQSAERPGFWDALFTVWRVRRRWLEERAELIARHRELRDTQDRVERGLERAAEAVQGLIEVLANLDREREVCLVALARDEDLLASSGLRAPDPLADEDTFEMTAPWADGDLDAARSRLFLAALKLHKAFLRTASRQLTRMLMTASRVLGGDRSLPRPVVRAAWQALFLVVPVVSTTFASLPRLFHGLGRNDLGWLLVDEAGQATPQAVVGGLARCRRAVIIGDPMQLEPIVSLPVPAQRALARHYGVDEQWLPDRRSAQTAADRVNRFGTAAPPGDPTAVDPGPDWVGAPLRVHRRCDRLMFDICNEIAYAHAPMVFGTLRKDPSFPRPSMWFDVRGEAQGNVVDAELDQLVAVVGALLRLSIGAEQIRVITPFTDVRRDARSRVQKEVKVGTLHSVQGTEADVVILVLGGGTEGARKWAAETPNLLNVAVSRARQCLCVIGDRQSWSALPYFSTAARMLPVREGSST